MHKTGRKGSALTFSPLTDVILETTKRSSRGSTRVSRVIVHNWAGIYGGIERLVYSKDAASANYIILSQAYKMPRSGRRLNGATVPAGTVLPAGTIIGSVDENYRAWTSGSWEADAPSITFEIQNSERGPSGLISQAAWNSTVRLLAELANRYKWGELKFGTTVRGHKEFQSTSCPGNYLWPRMSQLAADAQKVRTGQTPQKDGFLMALTDAEQKKLYGRIQNIQDILTGYAPNKYVKQGMNFKKVAEQTNTNTSRIRNVKDILTGYEPNRYVQRDGAISKKLDAILDAVSVLAERIETLEKAGTNE